MNMVITLLLCLLFNYHSFTQGNNYMQNYNKFQGLTATPPMGWIQKQ